MAGIQDIKVRKYSIDLEDLQLNITFDFNALSLIEEIYGDINKAIGQLETTESISLIRDLVWAGAANQLMDMKTGEMSMSRWEIGSRLSMNPQQLQKVVEVLARSFHNSLPEQQQQEASQLLNTLNAPLNQEERVALGK